MNSFRDKLGGKSDQTAGKLKEMAGETVNDESLAEEGRAQKTRGKVKEATQQVEEAAEDAADTVRKHGR